MLQKETLTRLICLAIGLLYLGKQQEVEAALELAKVLEGQVGLHATLTLETCAYAGTGNVLKGVSTHCGRGEVRSPVDSHSCPCTWPSACGGRSYAPLFFSGIPHTGGTLVQRGGKEG